MKQRGRRSSAKLAVVSEIKDHRPQPPKELNKDEAELWRSITQTKPPEWWDAGSIPLLLDYCKLHTSCATVQAEIDSFAPEWLRDDDGLERYNKLISIRDKMHGRQAQLAMKMRLTQQSRYADRTAHREATKAASTARVWERQ